jgi:hypothetical protein
LSESSFVDSIIAAKNSLLRILAPGFVVTNPSRLETNQGRGARDSPVECESRRKESRSFPLRQFSAERLRPSEGNLANGGEHSSRS